MSVLMPGWYEAMSESDRRFLRLRSESLVCLVLTSRQSHHTAAVPKQGGLVLCKAIYIWADGAVNVLGLVVVRQSRCSMVSAMLGTFDDVNFHDWLEYISM